MIAAQKALRYALAAKAYRANSVRLIETDLSGCDHLLATRRGLFAVNPAAIRLIAFGLFYGLTIRGDQIFAFEACDAPRSTSTRGRIVRFRRDGDRIVAADVIATGLDNGCHQIDIVDDRLCVTDTYNQRILRYPLTGGEAEVLHPIPGIGLRQAGDTIGQALWDGGYVHINSLIAHGDDILLMLHNGAAMTDRPSEIARLDRQWRLIERVPIDGLGCHSFAVLEDGAILTCGSLAGELIGTDGTKVPVCDMMTRGLSVDDDTIVVGGTAFADRDVRDDKPGAIFFLDRDYRVQASVAVPGPPMEIRRIDGRDRSLSDHVAAAAASFLKTKAAVPASGSRRSSAP